MVPVTMFISYAHEDEQLLKALKTHLEGLRRQGLIDTWFDRKIGAGEDPCVTFTRRIREE